MFLNHDDVLFKTRGGAEDQMEPHHRTNKAQPENTTV